MKKSLKGTKHAQKRNVGALSVVLKRRLERTRIQGNDHKMKKLPVPPLASDQREGESFQEYLKRQPRGTKIVKVLGSEASESGATSQKNTQSLRSYMDELSSQRVKITSVKIG